jgi:RimJ/RimL family protein N-acetyltransferase
MKKEILFTEGEYVITRYDGIPDHAITFWKRISWGNEGAVYQNMKIEEHIPLIINPKLLAIEKNNEIQGTGVFSNMTVLSGQTNYNCQYIRYFATDPAVRGQGLMKKYSAKTMKLVSEGETLKTVYFALVEKGNKASYKAVQNTGYSHVGTIKTIGFSRFFPKERINIHRITSEQDKKQVIENLSTFYRHHSLVQFNPIFQHQNYYVLKNEQGDWIAGCQLHRCHWKVNRMPGKIGKFMVKTLPYFPFLRRIFNPKKFEFLAFEGIFCIPGHEKKLAELFDGLLAKEKVNSAMMWIDEKDQLLKGIINNNKLGLIHSFVKKNDVMMMQAYFDFTNDERANFVSKPFYASAFDYA